MGYKRFSLFLTLRLSLVMAALLLLAYLLLQTQAYASILLVTAVVTGMCWETHRFVSRTNQELSRFLDAARYADFSQKFDLQSLGTGFPELGETFNGIMAHFREDRRQHEQEFRHLRALIEQVPTPLISLFADQQVTLWNNAARRLFGVEDIQRLDDLRPFGEELVETLTSIRPGERRLARFVTDEQQLTLAVAATEITSSARGERVLSLQNIQRELDGSQQEAWQDLVRVLTHEILNSITPVASLSKTSAQMIAELDGKLTADPVLLEEFHDIQDAITTIARRSDSLMNFVTSYRKLTRLPDPELSHFPIQSLIDDVVRVASADWDPQRITIHHKVVPETLAAEADRAMLEQVLINLVKNAEQGGGRNGMVNIEINARLNRRGRVVIEVGDNGPGIDDDIASKIFVPFYTTKREGSGVGLALSRQIMVAHGGAINAGRSPAGGALFTLVL